MSQPVKRPIYVSRQPYGQKPGVFGSSQSSTGRKPVTCFHCGKQGQIAKECTSRLADLPKPSIPESREGKDTKPIVCFSCREVGHKSPQCPNKRKEKVKKIMISSHKIQCLQENDVMTLGWFLPS